MEVYGDISTLIHKWLSIRIQFERNTYIGILILMKIFIYKNRTVIYMFLWLKIQLEINIRIQQQNVHPKTIVLNYLNPDLQLRFGGKCKLHALRH